MKNDLGLSIRCNFLFLLQIEIDGYTTLSMKIFQVIFIWYKQIYIMQA